MSRAKNAPPTTAPTTAPATPSAAQQHSDTGMSEFGYAQTLERSLGGFATFAAGVSFISILTGCFQLFYFGFSFGGAAYWWTWPLVAVGQLLVALCFAELAARYPLAGSVYNWAKRLGGQTVAFLGGWLLVCASVFTLAGVALAMQITLPQIWSGFQVIGDGTGPHDYALNGVLLSLVIILFTTVVNAWGVKLMAVINSAGVLIELVAAVALAIGFAVKMKQPFSELFDTSHLTAQPASGGYMNGFLIAALASGFVMFGFDTASSLGEESKDPRKGAPKAVLRAVTASAVIGGAILLFGILSAADLNDPRIGSPAGGLQFLVLEAFGPTLGTIFLVAVAIAVVVCALAIQTACMRAVFAMARDNSFPFSRAMSRVHPVTKTPVVPAITVGGLAVAILLVLAYQASIFTVVTSAAVAFIYAAYLCVTIPMLVRRLQGAWPGEGPGEGYFQLGRWGLPVNALAIVWGVFMTGNMLWPRAETYGEWPWGGFLLFLTVSAAGLAYFVVALRGRTGVLEGHRAGAEAPVTSPAGEPEEAVAAPTTA